MNKVFFFLGIDERTQDQIVASHSFAQRSVLEMISHHETNKTKKKFECGIISHNDTSREAIIPLFWFGIHTCLHLPTLYMIENNKKHNNFKKRMVMLILCGVKPQWTLNESMHSPKWQILNGRWRHNATFIFTYYPWNGSYLTSDTRVSSTILSEFIESPYF